MESLIETTIYLLAIAGIIFTTFSFFDSFYFINKNICTYILFENKKRNKIEIILKLANLKEDEEKELIRKLQKGEYNKLEEIIDTLKIERY